MIDNQYPSRPWYRHWWGMALAGGSALGLAILLAAGIYFFQAVRHYGPSAGLGLRSDEGKAPEELLYNSKSYSYGSPRAELVIVVFADYACPNCHAAYPAIRELMNRYRDRVRFIHRDYPVVTEYSYNLALAARCAGEQGFFWPMNDRLYQADPTPSTPAELESLAAAAGADRTRFRDCLDTERPKADIIADLDAGEALGVGGTPTFFIGGRMVEGAIPYETFKQIIEGELQ